MLIKAKAEKVSTCQSTDCSIKGQPKTRKGRSIEMSMSEVYIGRCPGVDHRMWSEITLNWG